MADKITKLSQAIRLGATFRPQCQLSFFRNGGSCALGAAYEAISGIDNEHKEDIIWVLTKRFGGEAIAGIIEDNDAGRTREQIAEDLERKGL